MNLRIDRLVTLGISFPALKVLPLYKGNGIPILMYHSISDSSLPGKHPYFQIHTRPEVFRAQMEVLKNNGYVVVGLKHAVEVMHSEKGSQYKYVVVTFDDAYKDFLTHALPILNDCDFTATIFVPSGFVGKTSNRLLNKECLAWEDLAQLSQSGIEIGSHTVSHQNLASLNQVEIGYELAKSKELIEQEIRQEVLSFSCPYAYPQGKLEFQKFYVSTLKKCGYLYGVTTKIGLASSSDGNFTLKRVPINDLDDEKLFKAKLLGGYDWVSVPQRLVRIAKVFTMDSRKR